MFASFYDDYYVISRGQLLLAIHVRSTARNAIHWCFDISTKALEIRAIQSPKSDALLTVHSYIVNILSYIMLCMLLLSQIK
jgi:hypothetical protein